MIEDIKRLNELTGAGLLDCKKALTSSEGDFEKAVAYLKEKGIAKAVKKESRIAAEGVSAIARDGNKVCLIEVNSETDFVAKNQIFIDFVQTAAATALKHGTQDVEALLAVKEGNETFADKLVAMIARIGEKLSIRRLTLIDGGSNEVGTYLHTGGKIGAVVVCKGSAEVAKDMAMQVASCAPTYIQLADIDPTLFNKEVAEQLDMLHNDDNMKSKPEQMLAGIAQGKARKAFAELTLYEQVYIKDTTTTVGKHLQAAKGEVLSFIRYLVGEGMEKRCDDFASEVMRQTGN